MADFPNKKIIEQLKSDKPEIVDAALNEVIKNYRNLILKKLQSISVKLEDAEEMFDESLSTLVEHARKGLLDKPNLSIKSHLIDICIKSIGEKFNDKKIIEQLKSDKPEIVDAALKAIIKEYRRDIINLLVSKSAKLEDAEEVFNESLVILVKNARKGLLDKPDAKIKPYLIKICLNRMWTRFNKRIDFDDLDLPEIQNIALETNHLDFLLKEERKKLIEEMIQRLGKKCQEIILRFYWYDQRMKAIAEQMGYASEQAARNKKSKCMKSLRELFGGGEFPFLD